MSVSYIENAKMFTTENYCKMLVYPLSENVYSVTKSAYVRTCIDSSFTVLQFHLLN